MTLKFAKKKLRNKNSFGYEIGSNNCLELQTFPPKYFQQFGDCLNLLTFLPLKHSFTQSCPSHFGVRTNEKKYLPSRGLFVGNERISHF